MRSRRSPRSRGCALFFGLIVAAVVSDALAAGEFLSLGIAWSRPLPAPLSAPPAVDATAVYLPLRNGRIAAVSLDGGRPLWEVDAPVSLALALGDGRLFAATPTELIAIETRDGAVMWKLEVPETIAPPAWRAGWMVLGRKDGTLLAVRASDGQRVWELALGSPLAQPVTIDGDRVFAPLHDGSVVAIDIVTGAIVWRTALPGAPGPVTSAGDRLYVGCTDNFFYALDAKDGDRRWRWRTGADVIGHAAVDAERVYFVSLDNVLRALDARSGVQRWRYALDSRPSAGPVLDGNVVIMSSVGAQVPVVAAATGKLAGRWSAPAELAQPLVFVPDANAAVRAVIVTGAPGGGWRLHGLGPSIEPMPGRLREIPGRPLSPELLPLPREAPPRGA